MIKINCDLCGKVEENLARALIEEVQLDVCTACEKFGKVIAQPKRMNAKEQARLIQKQALQKGEKTELLVEGYADIVKRKRESMGLTQKDFAGKINEKEATMHKIETGILAPPLALARKLEKVLGVKLIEDYEDRHKAVKKSRFEGFTLGDFIKANK